MYPPATAAACVINHNPAIDTITRNAMQETCCLFLYKPLSCIAHFTSKCLQEPAVVAMYNLIRSYANVQQLLLLVAQQTPSWVA
jgi:hypothetical protein